MPQNQVEPYQTSVTIGTSVVELLPDVSNLQRRGRPAFSIVNTSTGGQTISLGFGIDAVNGNGVVLYPGGTYSEALDSAFIPYPRRITGVASAAGGTAAIQERVE